MGALESSKTTNRSQISPRMRSRDRYALVGKENGRAGLEEDFLCQGTQSLARIRKYGEVACGNRSPINNESSNKCGTPTMVNNDYYYG